jgi:hypothetical protein
MSKNVIHCTIFITNAVQFFWNNITSILSTKGCYHLCCCCYCALNQTSLYYANFNHTLLTVVWWFKTWYWQWPGENQILWDSSTKPHLKHRPRETDGSHNTDSKDIISKYSFQQCKQTVPLCRNVVSWVLTPYSLVSKNRRFGGTYCLHLQGWWAQCFQSWRIGLYFP